jgi:hypothetical protein
VEPSVDGDGDLNTGEPSATRSSLRLERGILKQRKPLTATLISEDTPYWVLGMKSVDWESFNCLKYEDASRPEVQSALGRLSSKQRILPNRNSLLAECHLTDIALVSGSPLFLRVILPLLPPGLPLLFQCNRTSRRKEPLPVVEGLTWHWISHARVGGVTNQRILLGVRNIQGWALAPRVARSIGHIIAHSERPRPCQKDATFSHYTPLDILDRGRLALPVLYPSHFSFTGFGHRSLTGDELCSAFDIPNWMKPPPEVLANWMDTDVFSSMLPLQLFSAVLDETVPLIAPARDIEKPTPPSVDVGDTSSHGVLLVDINKFLVHSWIDPGLISEKAVKADDAGVATGMWDKRISLVLSVAVDAMNKIRTMILRRLRRRNTRSLISFLSNVHGGDWMEKIARLRQASKRRLEAARAAALLGLRKRKRGGLVTEQVCHREFPAPTEYAPEVFVPGAGTIFDLERNADIGADVLRQVNNATWWAYDRGSALLFWRWNTNKEIVNARDGTPLWVDHEKLPHFQRPQKAPQLEDLLKVAEKLWNVRMKFYIRHGSVYSLSHYFHVAKGEPGPDSDIRMVYNGTGCGLNKALWAPSFWMPTSASAVRKISFYSWMMDLDLGEMFLNFPMDPKVRPYAGVDFKPTKKAIEDLNKNRKEGPEFIDDQERWERLFMGMRPSPFIAIQYLYLALEMAVGDRRDKKNPMRWDRVRLNLPGDPSFDPSLPFVMKWNELVKKIAGDLEGFMDDLRTSGYSIENVWQVSRQIASRLQYLGIQDAPRKRRPPSKSPGAWAGAMHATSSEKVSKSVSEAKWTKGKRILTELLEELEGDHLVELDFKTLESKTGFLGHLSMTFEFMVPFLKGFYLTLNGWRSGRKEDGWKMKDKEWISFLRAKVYSGDITEEEFARILEDPEDSPPSGIVRAVPRLYSDVVALLSLMQSDTPAEISLRVSRVLFVLYGFADASGTGFGSSFQLSEGLAYRIGVWNKDEASETSNFREFANVIEALEEEGASGKLSECMVFFCTDNSTVESALYKGTSSSPKLLDLVIRYHQLQSKYGIIILTSHVSGKRMIAQGTDGLSRGLLNEGVMAGESFFTFVPFNLSASLRSSSLVPWIRSWAGEDVIHLQPEDWFERAHDISGWKMGAGQDTFKRPRIHRGCYLWTPPPAAADVALEQLRQARHKRQDSFHIFVCPKLMTPRWQKQLYKSADIVFVLPIGTSCWPSNRFEPCLVGLCFPFLRCRPWQLQGSPKMYAVGRQLLAMSKEGDMDQGHILRELCNLVRRLPPMPGNVVRRMLYIK